MSVATQEAHEPRAASVSATETLTVVRNAWPVVAWLTVVASIIALTVSSGAFAS